MTDAIKRAYELAAPYLSASITISMFPGTHYLLRSNRHKYIPIKVDYESQNIDLVIKPFYMGETGATLSNSIAYSSSA